MSVENEVYTLESKLRTNEALFTKEKALLEQKVQLLKIELSEVKDRAENQAKMYEMMLEALKPVSEKSQLHSLTEKLNLDNSLHGEHAKQAIQKYLESAGKLEEILNSIRESSDQHHQELTERLVKEHQLEKDKIRMEYSKAIAELRAKCENSSKSS